MEPIHFLHGIKTFANRNSFTSRFAAECRRGGLYPAEEHHYGYLSPVAARWKNFEIAETLWETIPEDSIVVAHSNGATLLWMLDQMGKKFKGAVLIQPALDREKLLHRAEWVHVYFNKKDCAVSLSRLLLAHPWGPQGKDGPLREPEHYQVFDTMNTEEMPQARGHNWYKDAFLRRVWWNFIQDKIWKEAYRACQPDEEACGY